MIRHHQWGRLTTQWFVDIKMEALRLLWELRGSWILMEREVTWQWGQHITITLQACQCWRCLR
jgi:hypothetical protein